MCQWRPWTLPRNITLWILFDNLNNKILQVTSAIVKSNTTLTGRILSLWDLPKQNCLSHTCINYSTICIFSIPNILVSFNLSQDSAKRTKCRTGLQEAKLSIRIKDAQMFFFFLHMLACWQTSPSNTLLHRQQLWIWCFLH